MPMITPMPDPAGPLVALLAYDGLCTFEFGIAHEVFGLPRPELGPGWYRCITVAVDPGPMRAAGGLEVAATAGLERLGEADLIIVPGWRGIEQPVPEALCAALREAHARGATLASLCSGAFVLAASGLLDGRRATTHWRYLDALRAAHPAIKLETDRLYVEADRMLTAAGSAAGIDLCLHIVRSRFGVEAANSVARRMVVPPHRDGGQVQYVERPVPRSHEGTRLSALIQWMHGNLAEPHTIAGLARRAGMSARTFQRRFEETTGLAPGAWLVRERLSLARELLERHPAESLEDVAELAGFGSLATLRHHFRARIGISPTVYRDRFGGRTSSPHARGDDG